MYEENLYFNEQIPASALDLEDKPWTLMSMYLSKKKVEKQLEAVYKIMHTKKLEPPLLKFHLYFYG